MTPDQAWSIWTGAVSSAPEDESLAVDRERAEIVILEQRPRTVMDATRMLDVLAANVEAGSRTDRRDLVALRRLKAFLDRAPEMAGVPPASGPVDLVDAGKLA